MTHQHRPTFSVVIASVGRPALLTLQVTSLRILLGRRQGWEVVVVADTTIPDIPGLDELALQWIVSEPLPANDLRNVGARLCSGDYLIFLDDDDFIYANWAPTFESLNDGSDLLSVSADAVHERVLKGDVTADRTTRARHPRHTASRFGVEGSSQLGGTFAVRRTLYEGIGGYRAGLRSLQHTDFFLRLMSANPSLSVSWTETRCIAIGERRESLKRDRGLAERRVESADLLLREHGLLQGRSADVASFLDASAFYAHVAGRRRDEWRFSRRAFVRRPTLKRALRLLRILTPVPRPNAPYSSPPAINRVGQIRTATTSVVITARGGDEVTLAELCRTLSRTPGVVELIVVVHGGADVPAPDVGPGVAMTVVRSESSDSWAARGSGLQHVRSSRVIFFDEEDIVIPAGLAMLLELVQMSDDSTVVGGAQIFDSGVHAPWFDRATSKDGNSEQLADACATAWPTELARSARVWERASGAGEVPGGAAGARHDLRVSGFPVARRSRET